MAGSECDLFLSVGSRYHEAGKKLFFKKSELNFPVINVVGLNYKLKFEIETFAGVLEKIAGKFQENCYNF